MKWDIFHFNVTNHLMHSLYLQLGHRTRFAWKSNFIHPNRTHYAKNWHDINSSYNWNKTYLKVVCTRKRPNTFWISTKNVRNYVLCHFNVSIFSTFWTFLHMNRNEIGENSYQQNLCFHNLQLNWVITTMKCIRPHSYRNSVSYRTKRKIWNSIFWKSTENAMD